MLTIGVEVSPEPRRELSGLVLVLLDPLPIVAPDDPDVQQLRELDREASGVVVGLFPFVPPDPVAGPAVADVEGVEGREVPVEGGPQLLGRDTQGPDQRQVDEDAEPQPVVLRHPPRVDLAQPARQVAPRRPVIREPELPRRDQERVGDRLHLDHPLIAVADIPPVLGVAGIRAVPEAGDPGTQVDRRRPRLGDRPRGLQSEKVGDYPQGPGKAFELGRAFAETGAGSRRQFYPSTSRGPIAPQRPDQL